MKKFKRVIPSDIKVEDLTPLNISCGSTKCEENLHCFSLAKTAIRKYGKSGVCIECGVNLIDWGRFQKKDIRDAKFIFRSLKFELIRHVFWHTKIDTSAINKAINLGRIELRKRVYRIIKSRVGKYNAYIDNRQTPLGKSEIVNYAQHATASCCRKCMEAWYNIPKNEILNSEELDFFTELAMLYIDERVPNLRDEPQ